MRHLYVSMAIGFLGRHHQSGCEGGPINAPVFGVQEIDLYVRNSRIDDAKIVVNEFVM